MDGSSRKHSRMTLSGGGGGGGNSLLGGGQQTTANASLLPCHADQPLEAASISSNMWTISPVKQTLTVSSMSTCMIVLGTSIIATQ